MLGLGGGRGWVRLEKRQILFEDRYGSIGIQIPHLQFSRPGRGQQLSFSIPVRPLKVVQELKITAGPQSVANAQAVHCLVDTELAACPAQTLHE